MQATCKTQESTTQTTLIHLASSVTSMLWFCSPFLRSSQLRSPWLHSSTLSLAKCNPIFTYRHTHNIAMSCPSLPLNPDSPWDPNYPISKNQTPSAISRNEVLSMVRQGQKPGKKDFLLIDLRHADHVVCDAKLRIFDEQLLTAYLIGRNYPRIDQLASTELVSRSSYALYAVCKCGYQMHHMVLRYVQYSL